MIKENVNPAMITLARESRGLSMNDLGNLLGMWKSYVSKIEKGTCMVQPHYLKAIAKSTQYPVSFFYLPGTILPVHLSFFRSKEEVPSRFFVHLEARMNIIRNLVELLSESKSNEPYKLPSYHVTAEVSPQELARQFRQDRNLGTGVLEDLTALVESMGIVVHEFDFGIDRISSRSMLTTTGRPIIFINSQITPDRYRFVLSFELAHLLLHTNEYISPDRNVRHEAKQFAAALLMPEEIAADYQQPVTLSLLGSLKRKWRVSMISLLYRADDLGLITPEEKQQLLTQFQEQHLMRHEPPGYVVEREIPYLLKELTAAVDGSPSPVNGRELKIGELLPYLEW
jgi:Zn-dependent peptidase ImmA (M78 family)